MTTSRPAPIYRVTIDWKNRVYELFDEFDDAVAFARNLMETDGTKRFLGEKTPGSGILKWEDITTGKKIFRQIGTTNNHEIFQWELEQRRKKQVNSRDKIYR